MGASEHIVDQIRGELEALKQAAQLTEEEGERLARSLADAAILAVAAKAGEAGAQLELQHAIATIKDVELAVKARATARASAATFRIAVSIISTAIDAAL